MTERRELSFGKISHYVLNDSDMVEIALQLSSWTLVKDLSKALAEEFLCIALVIALRAKIPRFATEWQRRRVSEKQKQGHNNLQLSY